MIAVDFAAVDHWFEEDVEVFVHPRSPLTRIDALASSRHVVVSVEGVTLADTRKPTLLFETLVPTRHYVPMVDVNLDLLVPSDTRSSCPYKGHARYWSAQVGGQTHADLAWSYPTPLPEVTPIAGQICFFDERVDIAIDGVLQERPRSHFA